MLELEPFELINKISDNEGRVYTLMDQPLGCAMECQRLAVLMTNPQPEVRERLLKCMVLVISIIVASTHGILQTIYPKDPEPYHTSALTGQDWVIELLTGHPEHIRCELGMHTNAFVELISELRTTGHSDFKFVSLEEQLAIFLYTSMTGLSIRHVVERFQRLNETISQ
jgi:hypothetical protein